MQLDGGVVGFDNATRSNDADSWAEGDKIYLQFMVGTNVVDGAAIYNATTEEWDVQYYGTITTGTEAKCEAYYFENAVEATHTTVTLNEHTAIYCDKDATYLFENDVLKVSASLVPMTGRIRLAGDISQDFCFSGIKHYTSYSITDNGFSTDAKNHVSTVDTEGYSEYYYGFFPDETKKEIFFDDLEYGISYSKVLGEQALAVGRSGYLNIPSLENRSGWETLQFKDFTVSNVTFRMIRVVDDLYILPSYWIAETETTQELWKAVMGSSSNPSTFTGTNMPVNNVSWEECQTFITKLNSKLGTKFRLPSMLEWQCAFRGACLSKGYTYSGSDYPSEVAWYASNSPVNGTYTTHPVKQLKANEIGAYDMSGNVAEWVNDTYLSSGITRGYVYGGAYDDSSSSLSYDDYNYPDITYKGGSGYGFRLAL